MSERAWVDCWQCGGEGYLEGTCTCGEDTCCCLDPEPETCDICHGDGGWWSKPGLASPAMDSDAGM